MAKKDELSIIVLLDQSSGHWNSRYVASSGSWVETGKTGDRHHRRLHGNQLNVPAIISSFAKGKRGLVSERIHTRLACYEFVIHFSLVPTASCLMPKL